MFTDVETKILIEECKNKLSIISGKLTDPLSRDRKEDAWNDILCAVNSFGGGYTKDQVVKRWANIRSKALGTVRDFNKKSKSTGGGPPIVMPSEETFLFVSDVIEKTKIDGIEGALDDTIILTPLTAEPAPVSTVSLTAVSENTEIRLPQKATKRKTRTEESSYELERKRLSLQIEVLELQKEHYKKLREQDEMQNEQFKQQKNVMTLLNEVFVTMRDKYHIESQKIAMENFMLKSKLASENITFNESYISLTLF